MTIREATGADLPLLEELWRAFWREVPEPVRFLSTAKQ